ncbi:TRAP transporter large permease [Arthrobacter sp. zg-Y820]|uniref:TRAP transporter large permease n=1 Tax=unclassified Arthrobacter TaxID=235627 RepID=UPI001E2F01C3|nr:MULTISPECIES: TRAP transporter large permease [unclassified Arthrobacter]MCC9195247.1 TRAP transporter large permease [Arthrobacter sp. zg-Y820]MDK1278106.1 TRAP transporter large permease [Arthrobacter sp. zg.Y820]MDK1361417.1 TRAP transporter large permease [Arthrobacter sp. zg-Y1219]WIB09996.1 TRAP transporter large permease [Arthrobacter sp. zg-Y820]
MMLTLLGIAIAVLLVLRVPVAIAFLGPSLVYMSLNGRSPGSALREVANAADSFPLLAVPLFILLGALANHAGIADRLFRFAMAAFASVRGNLGYVSVGVSLGFSWMSGSAVADAAALGKVEIPAMLRNGYSRRFATGVVASSSLIAPVMPPSIPAVIFSGLAAVSTGALFAASVIPALLMTLGLCIVVFFLVRRQPNLVRGRFDRTEFLQSLKGVILPLLAPIIILGGILGGIFTPTEAAAVGVVYMLLLGIVQRSLTLTGLIAAIKETVLTTSGIMLIVASASLLGYILARERLPQMLTEALFGLTDNPTVFLALVVLLALVLGCVIDATAILVLVVPILMPIAIEYGVDPVSFGVLLIISLMIGLLTPPVGTVLFVTSAVSKTRIGEVFRGSLPFIIPFLVIVILIVFFPDAVQTLPRWLGL